MVHWLFEYRYDNKSAVFDDEPVKDTLGDIPLSEPEVLTCIRNMIEETVLGINPEFLQDSVTLINQPIRR